MDTGHTDDEHPAHHPHKRRGLIARFRANFLTGLVVIAPVGLTFWLIWKVTGWIDSWVLPFIPSATSRANWCATFSVLRRSPDSPPTICHSGA